MQTVCTNCPAGFYCQENATDYLTTACLPGYYCPLGTTDPYEFPCPKGSYNPASGSDDITDCLSCPPGEYCDGTFLCHILMI